MLTAAYKIKWVAGYFVSSTSEFFYSAVIHRVCFVICFLFNLKGDLNEVNSPLFGLFGLFAGGCVEPRVRVAGGRQEREMLWQRRGIVWTSDQGKEEEE